MKEQICAYWGDPIEREPDGKRYKYYAKNKEFSSLKAAKDYIYNSLNPYHERR